MTSRDRELQELANAAKRARRVPPGATCEVCGKDAYLSARRDGSVRCYEHLGGNEPHVERDHWAGESVLDAAVIPLLGNAHRYVTDLRRVIGMDDLPPPNGDPLLLLAHLVMGVGSLLVLFGRWLAAYVLACRSGLEPPPFPVVP